MASQWAGLTCRSRGRAASSTAKAARQATASQRGTPAEMEVSSPSTGSGLSQAQPIAPARAMISSCVQAVAKVRAATAATMAMVARHLSGAKLRPMDQTAWATTTTAAIFSPWSHPAPEVSQAATPRAKRVRMMADGRVNPSQAASPSGQPCPGHPDDYSNLAAGRSRQELAEGDDVQVGPVVQPLPARHVLLPEVAYVGDGAAEGYEPQPQRHEKHLEGVSYGAVLHDGPTG